MARLIIKRSIKKAPKRRARTYAEKLQRYDKWELLKLLITQPKKVRDVDGNIISNPVIPAIMTYLLVKHHMSHDEINSAIQKIKEKRNIKGDLVAYAKGLMTESDISKKYPTKQFITNPGVHKTAKHYNKFEIPTGEDYRKKTVQRLLIESQPIFLQFMAKKRAILQDMQNNREDLADKKDIELQEWLLQLAQRRPEFAANIAHILLTNKKNKEEKKSFKKNSLLKNQMEDLLTEREMAYYRKNPFVPIKLNDDNLEWKKSFTNTGKTPRTHQVSEDGIIEKEHIPDDDDEIYSAKDKKDMTKFKGEIAILPIPGAIAFDEKNKKFYEVHNKGGIGSVKNIGNFSNKPKFRKKKAKTKSPIRRKKTHKIIKAKKPIKRCRCK